MKRTRILALLPLVACPVVIGVGLIAFADERYNVVSVLVAVLACLPFFIAYEKKPARAAELVLVAVMTAIAAASRIILSPLPGFKPVTAVAAITGMYFGPQAGFLTGSLAALISNMFFGQGPWVPFQMFAWGVLGFLGGLFRPFLLPGRPLWRLWLSLYGLLAGLVFSMIMDIWSVFSMYGVWSWSSYFALMLPAVPYTLAYSASNIVFFMLLTKPLGDKLERVKSKYGV